jgi:hypothetical protein
MCRNIRQLHNFAPPATDEEIRAAAIQFVRKLSGFNKPSAANAAAFEIAVEEIAAAKPLAIRTREKRFAGLKPGGKRKELFSAKLHFQS